MKQDWIFEQYITETSKNKLLPTDFYWDRGTMIFTESYHNRRGYCCNNNCKHCPYKEEKETI